MTLAAIDFTSLYIPHIDDAAARQLVAGGWTLPVIGFDPSPESRQVLGALLNAGCSIWDAYRFLNWSKPLDAQLVSVRAGILAAYAVGLGLPGVLWLDVEEEAAGTPPAVDVRTALHTCIEQLFAWQIGPRWDVKLGIYSGLWFYQKYGLLDYTEPADRGLLLWTTATTSDPDRAQVYAGWKQAEGVQYAEEQASPIGWVDLDVFRDRTPAPSPSPARFVSVVATDETGKQWTLP